MNTKNKLLMSTVMATIAIGYCGKKEFETDHLYGSNLTWTPEDIHPVPVGIARKLLQHPDVYFDATEMLGEAGLNAAGQGKKDPDDPDLDPTDPTKTDGKDADPKSCGKKDPDDPDLDQTNIAPLVPFDTMLKADIVQYAQRHFGIELPASKTKDELIESVRELVNRQKNVG